jgi:CMP-N-acetylneuraminate monooxygenase
MKNVTNILEDFDIKNINFKLKKNLIPLRLDTLNDGVNNLSNFIVYVDEKSGKMNIYDRICDHNGGRLISKQNKIVCPFHNWQFNPVTGEYVNVNYKKKPLYSGKIKKILNLNIYTNEREINEQFNSNPKIKIQWINHACLIFQTGNFRIATDPWLIGPAFSNGWWLKHKSPKDCFEQINSCNLLFISHNHPDHLHPETLSKINKNINIITPNFKSNSTFKFLKDLGFNNITTLNFDKKICKKNDELEISLLKSGDFRDDSGILIQAGKFKFIATVDANFIDFYRFPDKIDVLASSFAGGASGFPLCFDNYTEKEKKIILERNKKTIILTNEKVIKLSKPKYFIPYAGFFIEDITRDKYIKKNNLKNNVNDYSKVCKKFDVQLLDVEKYDTYIFKESSLLKKEKNNILKIKEKSSNWYIKQTKNFYKKINKTEIEEYFKKSDFFYNLVLQIDLTNDNFTKIKNSFLINFYESKPAEISIYNKINKLNSTRNCNFEKIKVRYHEFLKVIKQGLPWEDLSIGFQCRIKRDPNVYNSDFWYHFSNIYVNANVKGRSENCSGCAIINQKIF